MIPSQQLRKAPFPTSWIMNKKNIHCTSSYEGIPCVLWKKKNNIQLWSFNHELYCIRDYRIFDMNDHLCGWIHEKDVYGPKFGTLPDVMTSSLFYF